MSVGEFIPGDPLFNFERFEAAHTFAVRCLGEAGMSMDDVTDWYHNSRPTPQQNKAYELRHDAFLHAIEHPEVVERILAEKIIDGGEAI